MPSPLAVRVAARHSQRVGYDRRVDDGTEPLEDDDLERDVRLLQRRLQRIADRGRELLLRARGEPTFGHTKLLKGIATLVALAERELPSDED
jgi:hypothetical protein